MSTIRPTVTFLNLNSASLQFDNLSIPSGSLASSASVTGSDYNYTFDIQSDPQIKDYIEAGYLVVGDGISYFDLTGSLNYVSTVVTKYTFDNENISDGAILYVTGSKIVGTALSGVIETGANVGSGQGVFKEKVGVVLQFRSLLSSGSINLVSGTNEITINSPFATGVNTGSGEGVFLSATGSQLTFRSISGSGIINVMSGAGGTIVISASSTTSDTASNTGSGEGVFRGKEGNNFVFRSILGSGSVTILSGSNDITVSGTTFVQYVSPAVSLDRSVVVYTGSTGRSVVSSSVTIDVAGNIDNVQGTYNGIRFYNKSASDPVSPPPSDGDRYYNTAMHLEMVYDGIRNKWLSNESFLFPWARSGNTAKGSFFQGGDNIPFTAVKGFVAPFSGTIVAIGYSREDVDAAVFEVTVTGSQIAFISSSATQGTSYALNADFGNNLVLGVRNQDLNGNVVTDIQGWARIRWRR